MLYVFIGSDAVHIRTRIREIIQVLRKRRGDAEVIYASYDDSTGPSLSTLANARTLFSPKYIVIAEQGADTDVLKELSISPHIFIVYEESVDTKKKSLYKKYAEKVEECVKKDDRFNIFKLADALCERNVQPLWVLYQEALSSGIPPEEIHGILSWQVDAIRRSYITTSAKEAGMKSYPFTKATRAKKNFSKKEVDILSSKLLNCLLSARRGDGTIETGLEAILVGIGSAH